jgi:ZIP family zinc transporter
MMGADYDLVADYDLSAGAATVAPGDLAFWGPLVQSMWAGAATGIGALFVIFQGTVPDPSMLAFSLAMAAGVMLVVSLLDMYIPLCVRDGLVWPTLTLFAGYILFYFASKLLPEPDFMTLPISATEDKKRDVEIGGNTGLITASSPRRNNARVNSSNAATGSGSARARSMFADSRLMLDEEKRRSMRLGIIMFLSLTAHNFPEGLAVSVSSLQSESLGFLVTVAIALHNIPGELLGCCCCCCCWWWWWCCTEQCG